MLCLFEKNRIGEGINLARHNNAKHLSYDKLEGQLHVHKLEVSSQQSLRKSDFFQFGLCHKGQHAMIYFSFWEQIQIQMKIVKTDGRSRLMPCSHGNDCVLFQWRSNF